MRGLRRRLTVTGQTQLVLTVSYTVGLMYIVLEAVPISTQPITMQIFGPNPCLTLARHVTLTLYSAMIEAALSRRLLRHN